MKKALLFCAFLAITAPSNATELTFSTTAMHFQKSENLCQERVTEIATRLGLELEFVGLTFERAMMWANDAKIDGVVARAESIEKAYPNLIKFGSECSSIVLDLVTMKSNEFEFIDWDNIPEDYSLGYVLGGELKSQEIGTKINLIEVGTRSHLIDMFLSERFELLLTPANSIPRLEKRIGRSLSVIKHHAIEIKMYPYIHKKHRHLLGAEADVIE